MRQTFDETTDLSFGAKHLPLLRAEMKAQGLDGLLVPHEDEHQNEYLPDANERLAWVSGFTGSAGAGVVLMDRAAVFVDGRYTVQVKAQTDEALFERVELNKLTTWLEGVAAGSVIGYDPRLHSPDALVNLRAAVEKAGATLKAVEANPIDLAWGNARPAQPQAPVVPHEDRYSGESAVSKRARIGQAIAAKGAEVAVLTAPSSLAWLFNIRGGDVIRTPLPLGQAVVKADGTAKVFLDPAKVTNELPGWLGDAVVLEVSEALPAALDGLSGQKVLIDPAVSSAWYFDRLEAAGATVVRGMDPCALPRAQKNEVEIEGSRQAHIRDGAALTRFLHWVDTVAQVELPDERGVVEALEGFREATGMLKDLSFDTIAGVGANGALPHYKPVGAKIRKMEQGSLLLVDGGAGQLAEVLAVMADLGVDDIAVVGVAKGPDRDAGKEHFFIPGKPPFMLPLKSPALYYIQRLRDEAHRFANGAHAKRRSMDIKKNPLDEIEGVGPGRKKALLHAFGSAKGVSRASVADLVKVDGVSQALAERIHGFFHKS
ncbi:aminopeptidase P family N-terminal domain-containing protein [uncultured Brevundimonas sp.]|uniref:aminopeptidase P family N-terminal domain-containing protein n=1 Tax=uncultured Brevundimonas sp. TaxID=213418 RepID=UPI0025DA5679|nr:aminopeptidase P family N-terminal domain-containing protein [uncultured Brevundimonas sp.]